MSEEWRPIPGFDGYEASSLGRIRSWRGWRLKPATEPRVLRLQCRDGYFGVVVMVDGHKVMLKAHRAVLLAFVGEPPTAVHQAAHGNGQRGDNRLANLRWASPVENAADKVAHGTAPRGEASGAARLSDANIRRMFAMYAAGTAPADIADEMGVSLRHVRLILRGKRWGHLLNGASPPVGRFAGQVTKITPADVKEIHRMRAEGQTHREIGARFGIHRSAITRICQGVYSPRLDAGRAHMPVDAQLRLVGK